MGVVPESLAMMSFVLGGVERGVGFGTEAFTAPEFNGVGGAGSLIGVAGANELDEIVVGTVGAGLGAEPGVNEGAFCVAVAVAGVLVCTWEKFGAGDEDAEGYIL